MRAEEVFGGIVIEAVGSSAVVLVEVFADPAWAAVASEEGASVVP